MESDIICEKYLVLYSSLKNVVAESEARVLRVNADDLFSENINFFVKSYLITICTYLEAYLQDIAYWRSCEISDRLKAACIPFNFIYWRSTKEVKERDLKFENASLAVEKKNIHDHLSGNPYKTAKLFGLLGVDLKTSDEFNRLREIVDAVVRKRNNIIHHNDRAMDLSFSDLISYIDIFKEYIIGIGLKVKSFGG